MQQRLTDLDEALIDAERFVVPLDVDDFMNDRKARGLARDVLNRVRTAVSKLDRKTLGAMPEFVPAEIAELRNLAIYDYAWTPTSSSIGRCRTRFPNGDAESTVLSTAWDRTASSRRPCRPGQTDHCNRLVPSRGAANTCRAPASHASWPGAMRGTTGRASRNGSARPRGDAQRDKRNPANSDASVVPNSLCVPRSALTQQSSHGLRSVALGNFQFDDIGLVVAVRGR